MSRFAEQIERYYDVFGKDAVKIVLLENMIVGPGATFRDVLAFLDVDESFRPVFKVFYEMPRDCVLERVVTSVYPAPLFKRALGGALGAHRPQPRPLAAAGNGSGADHGGR